MSKAVNANIYFEATSMLIAWGGRDAAKFRPGSARSKIARTTNLGNVPAVNYELIIDP
jgi:hypothetical protein